MAKKNFFKIVFNILLTLVVAAISGVLLLVLVYSLPVGNIEKNVEDSLDIFSTEGVYPKMYNRYHSTLDNFTDAIMLSAASHNGQEPLIDQALLVYFDGAKTENVNLYPTDAILFKHGKEIVYSQYKNGKVSTEDKIEGFVRTYPRYWHGYQVVLKPVLMLTTYRNIRIINFVIQILLCLILMFLMYKKHQGQLILPFIFAWGALLPPVIGASLQYSYVFYIAVIASILLFVKNEKWKNGNKYIYFFLICGIFTSYMDFLTYPLVTLCVPLVFYMSLNRSSVREDFFKVIIFAIVWGIGYVGMWAFKWILASLLTNENVIASAHRSLVSRSAMQSGDKQFTFIDVVGRNLSYFIKNPFVNISIVFLLITMVIGILKKRIEVRNIIVFGAIALSPFAWYMISGNHSYIHSWFTCKELMITVLASLCMFTQNQERSI